MNAISTVSNTLEGQLLELAVKAREETDDVGIAINFQTSTASIISNRQIQILTNSDGSLKIASNTFLPPTPTPAPTPGLISPLNMSSNNAPTPYVATASSSAGGGAEAYRAYLENTTSSWASAFGALPAWNSIDLGSAFSVSSFEIIGSTDWSPANFGLKDFKLQGSNDGSVWVDAATLTNVSGWAANVAKSFTVDTLLTRRYWRIYATASTGGAGNELVSFKTLKLIGYS